jgi:K+-sensing histidine kinase KdpD
MYALFNLLHNAFKYSENCKNIVMNLISNKSEIHVEIIDFGIGIPEEETSQNYLIPEQVIRKELREQVWASLYC